MKPKDFEIVAQALHDIKPEYLQFESGRFMAQAEDGGK